MSVNTMGFEQAAALLNGIYHQATGISAAAPVDTTQFVSMAQTTLQTGYDKVGQAISEVLGRTIFSIRPYSAKFTGIQVDSDRWGNHTRKINYVDRDVENNDEYSLTDNQSMDMYTVRKPITVQTNFYGAGEYSDWVTIYRHQLDTAFQGPEQFAAFISGVMQNMEDKLEQFRESQRRATLLNFVGAKMSADTSNVKYLITEYNNATGSTLTKDTIKAPENFGLFVKWFYGYMQSLTGLMSNRSIKYHLNITDKPIMRHTPRENMKAFINTQFLANVDSSVLSGVFQLEKMRPINWEEVDFWQTIDAPTTINVKANYIDATGTVKDSETAVTTDALLGVLVDDEALGMADKNTWTSTTPFNSRGGYYNQWYHITTQSWNDLTENGVVLILDVAP